MPPFSSSPVRRSSSGNNNEIKAACAALNVAVKARYAELAAGARERHRHRFSRRGKSTHSGGGGLGRQGQHERSQDLFGRSRLNIDSMFDNYTNDKSQEESIRIDDSLNYNIRDENRRTDNTSHHSHSRPRPRREESNRIGDSLNDYNRDGNRRVNNESRRSRRRSSGGLDSLRIKSAEPWDAEYQDSFTTQAFHGTGAELPKKPGRDPTAYIPGREGIGDPDSGILLLEGSRSGTEKREEELPMKPKRDPTMYVDGVCDISKAPSSRSRRDSSVASPHWSSCTDMDTCETDEYHRRPGRDPSQYSQRGGSYYSAEGEASAARQSQNCGSVSCFNLDKSFRSRKSTEHAKGQPVYRDPNHYESVESFSKGGTSYRSKGGRSSTSRGGKSCKGHSSVSKCGWEKSYAESDLTDQDSSRSANRRTSFQTQELRVGSNYSKGEADPHFADSVPQKSFQRSMRSDMSKSSTSAQISC